MLNRPTPEPKIWRLPIHRWQIHTNAQKATEIAQKSQISPIISQLLINRGVETLAQIQAYLNPESQNLPSPLEEFPDLALSVELLEKAIATGQKIAICGDYDADGMTSTALLLRSLRWLGAQVDYAIPSRMHEGYGINKRIVEEFKNTGFGVVITVDNGISAYDAIARARELGLIVIVTDHHDVPQKLPPANAILNPKLIAESSPYRGVAGVGVAYILAISLAQQLGQIKGLVKPLLELFTLGTIADLAPLTGVNRRWVKRGLQQLPHSQLAGVQALIQVSGVKGKQTQKQQTLKPDDIGFRLGPRINAIGRIADPQIVIELLTTDDPGIALERAMQCEQINQTRQQLCEQIETEAISVVEKLYASSLHQDRVLVLVQPNWHHGVIGIVASRLLERYGVPVFIGTDENEQQIRGSARGIPEFHIFAALEACKDLLGKFGGHQAAGGFSLPAGNLPQLRSRLITFANQYLQVEHLKPLLKIDAQLQLEQINSLLYQEILVLNPCGIENPDPVFWTANVQIVEQKIIGKGHIKLTVADGSSKIKAIAWRWGDYFPLPPRLDIAYRLRENTWNGNTTIELELLGAKLATPLQVSGKIWEQENHAAQISVPLCFSPPTPKNAKFDYKQRHYTCGFFPTNALLELRIKNDVGKVLAIQSGQNTGLLGTNRENATIVDLSQPKFYHLVQAALQALETDKKAGDN
ncbi:single-stranded-DNA-specific exonuclease RecJ [Synechocystis sp. PCC 7509]|uniref:single-stranded-DNA-specific exonuclease RecJ n=1 Tax=Synechocystis sp. PCC 7509 TaxID=927677 RepID=UPI0002AC0381|nr:single-stranded-DNA-specific exonuclease RecJ [Synechocystis sp. PCC 7509]